MRWDELFADLDAQVEARQIAERSAEIEDRTRYEFGQLTLVDRLRVAIGGQVRIRCAGGTTIAGRLDRVHPEWLLLIEATGREALVVGRAVRSVGGLGPWSAAAGVRSEVDARLGLRYALRTIARDRSAVRIQLRDGETLDGTLDRIGPHRAVSLVGRAAVALWGAISIEVQARGQAYRRMLAEVRRP